MASLFNVQVFAGNNPDQLYANVATKDQYCFYLLTNGKGYLGEQMLFDYTSPINTIATGTDMIDPNYTADDDSIATTLAIHNYVQRWVTDSAVLNAAFFREVMPYTLTAQDIAADPSQFHDLTGCKAGDYGLRFKADIDGNNDGDSDELYWFVNLTSITITTQNTTSVQLALTNDPVTGKQLLQADVKISPSETSVFIENTTDSVTHDPVQGIKLYKSSGLTVNSNNGTSTPVARNLVTEDVMYNYVRAYVDYVTENMTNSFIIGGGDPMEDEGDN